MFCLGNEFGPMVIIKFRLKSKCVKLGNACNASNVISWIWLFANSSVSTEIKPWKMGMRSNLLSLSCKSTRFGKLRIPSSHNSVFKLFCRSSLFRTRFQKRREERQKNNELVRRKRKRNQNNDRYIRYMIFLFESNQRKKK